MNDRVQVAARSLPRDWTDNAIRLIQADARRSAVHTGRRVLDVLEESSGLAPDAFLARLGDALRVS